MTNSSSTLTGLMSIEEGTATATITASSNYFADIKITGAAGEKIRYSVKGYEYVVDELYYRVNHNDTGIEKAWTTNPQASLKRLGYPQNIIDKIVVNPDPKTVTKDQIPIYLEQRRTKEFNGWIIGGKFDMVANGLLHDNKTTSAFTYMYGTRDEEYRENC